MVGKRRAQKQQKMTILCGTYLYQYREKVPFSRYRNFTVYTVTPPVLQGSGSAFLFCGSGRFSQCSMLFLNAQCFFSMLNAFQITFVLECRHIIMTTFRLNNLTSSNSQQLRLQVYNNLIRFSNFNNITIVEYFLAFFLLFFNFFPPGLG